MLPVSETQKVTMTNKLFEDIGNPDGKIIEKNI